MRILFVTPEYITEPFYDGGLANYLHRISLGLVDAGHEPIFVVASDRDEFFYHKGIAVHRVDVRSFWRTLLNRLTVYLVAGPVNWLCQSWALNRAAIKIHQAKSIDIIQSASYTATGVFRLTCVPSVVRISSYESLLRNANREKGSFSLRLLEFLEGLAIRRADGIFSPSKMLAEVITKETGQTVEVIESPFALDVDNFDDSQYREFLEGKDYLFFFGTLGRYKGVLVIAEMMAHLLSRHPQLYFVFVGKNLEYGGRPVMDLVWEKAGSHRDRVLYLGKLRHEQLYPVLQNSHAVVLPSLIDNFPNTCIEAMAFGKVVIGTHGTSFEQLIEHGVSGILCEPDSPQDLLEKVEEVLALDGESLCRIGKAAKERIALNSTSSIAQTLIIYYQKIIAAHLVSGSKNER